MLSAAPLSSGDIAVVAVAVSDAACDALPEEHVVMASIVAAVPMANETKGCGCPGMGIYGLIVTG